MNIADQEILFLAQQAKDIEGEISVSSIQRHLRIGFQKATAVFGVLQFHGTENLVVEPTPEVPVGNSHGKNAFRTVLVKCTECKGERTPQMQCDVGTYDWDCDLCGEKTKHVVTEVVPEDDFGNPMPAPVVEAQPVAEPDFGEPPDEPAFPVTSPALAIVEAACAPDLNIVSGLRMLIEKFKVGNFTQCTPLPGTTDVEIGTGVTVLCGVRNWTELGLGDLSNELEDRGYEDVIHTIISHLNLEDSYSTLSNYARTARAIPPDLRMLPGLKYSHLAEVACSKFSNDPIEQARTIREVLTEASEKGMNVTQTREACLNRKGKTTKPTAHVTEKPKYLMIDRAALLRGEIQIFSAVKEPLCDEAYLCISLENLDYSTECHGENLHNWIGIPVKLVVDPVVEEVAQ